MAEQDHHVELSVSFAAAIADREAQLVQELLNKPRPPIDFSSSSPADHVSQAAYSLIVQHDSLGVSQRSRP
jgi:hypothetical protein